MGGPSFVVMKDHTLISAESKSLCADIFRHGTRRFLFSTVALERAIENDSRWRRKARAYRLRYLFDAIIRQRLNVARIASRRSTPCNLSSRALTFAIGADYKESVLWLMYHGILESDGEWRQGEKCLGYHIPPKGWRGGIVPVAMSEREITRYSKARARLNRGTEKQRDTEGVPLDFMRFHLGGLTFTEGAVETHFVGLAEPETFEEAEKYHAHAYATAAVIAKDWTFHRCRAGRLHYPLTNLPKALRRQLRLGGERLMEIDVSSCQPFLACSLYSSEHGRERARYISDVRSDSFYEQIGRIAGFTGNRRELKKAILASVFFGSREQAAGAIWETFAGLYPVLAEILMESKRVIKRPWRGDCEMALRLQRAESSIFIDGALRRIAEEMPEIPALPIHDCLLTVETNVAEVESILSEEFLRHFDVAPRFWVKAV